MIQKHRLLLPLLMAVVMMAMSPARTWALSGSGTSSDPYEIYNASDLKEFRDIVLGQNGKSKNISACCRLMDNITSLGSWTPIGNSSNHFKGTFDGNHMAISGMTTSSTDKNDQGLFGYVEGATIKDFTISGSVTSKATKTEVGSIGGVIGIANGTTQISGITCSVNVNLTGTAQRHIGGIVGYISETASVSGCTYSGTIDAGSSSDCIGGIAGYADGSVFAGSIKYCLSNCTIKTTATNPILGGILAYLNDTGKKKPTIQYNLSDTQFKNGTEDLSSGTYINGIIGRIQTHADNVKYNTFIRNGNLTNAINTDGKIDIDTTTNKAVTISVSSTNEEFGTVSTSYVNPTTSTATQLQVVATPKAHHHFSNWSDGGAQTHIVDLTSDVSLNAIFAIDRHTITLKKYGDYDYRCKLYVNGTESTGGTYDYGTQLTLKAVPDTYCNFSAWKNGNTNVSETAEFSYTVTGDATLTAVCYKNNYILTLETNNADWGTVSGPTDGKCDAYNDVTITATPAADYRFVNWTKDGTVVSTNASCNYRAHGNETLVANFAPASYKVTVASSNTNYGTASIDNKSDNDRYAWNSQITLKATAHRNCRFIKWSDGNTDNPRTLTVTDEAALTAEFENAFTIDENNQLTKCKTWLVGDIYIPDGITSIAEDAFFRCSDITSVTIPASVTSIGAFAFDQCCNLKTVIVQGTSAPTLGQLAFRNCHDDLAILVPCASEAACKTAKNWSSYQDKIEGYSPFTNDIAPSVNNEAWGAVSYNSEADCQTPVLTATPAPGYVFSHWKNPDGSITLIKEVLYPADLTMSGVYQAVFEADDRTDQTYLYFKARLPYSTVKLKKNGSPEPITLEYSTDGTSWTEYTIGTDIILQTPGDRVYFRNSSETAATKFSGLADNYQFVMSGTIEAGGNVMSLIDKSLTKTDLSGINNAFNYLFHGCTSLTTAPALPATTLAHRCYYYMFEGCTSLTTAPALPATTIADGCYTFMFEGCTSLTTAPALPATTLADHCYFSMFEGCTSLTTAPALPATTLADYCYAYMFEGCTSLKMNTEASGYEWAIPSGADDSQDCWNYYIFYDTGGTFTDNASKGTTYYTDHAPAVAGIKLNSDGFATYSAPFNAHIVTEGVMACTAEVKDDYIALTLINGDIPAGTGVILYGKNMGGADVVITTHNTADALATIGTNDLKPSTLADGTLAAMPADKVVYMLDSSAGKAFCPYTGSSFAHNSAYLQFDTAPAVEGNKLDMTFNGVCYSKPKYDDCYNEISSYTYYATDYSTVTGSDDKVTWDAGWYVVDSEVTIAKRITCNGDVHLILAKGGRLNAKEGITVTGTNTLSIYGQPNGAGLLVAISDDYATAIGIESDGDVPSSNIVINAGVVYALAHATNAVALGPNTNGNVIVNKSIPYLVNHKNDNDPDLRIGYNDKNNKDKSVLIKQIYDVNNDGVINIADMTALIQLRNDLAGSKLNLPDTDITGNQVINDLDIKFMEEKLLESR